jgi:hypothetical protein
MSFGVRSPSAMTASALGKSSATTRSGPGRAEALAVPSWAEISFSAYGMLSTELNATAAPSWSPE